MIPFQLSFMSKFINEPKLFNFSWNIPIENETLGPISSSFVNRFGCRIVAIAGSILTSACLLASYYATNVITLIFTIGEAAVIFSVHLFERFADPSFHMLDFICSLVFCLMRRYWSGLWIWLDLFTGKLNSISFSKIPIQRISIALRPSSV